jgi:hypothetical protein
MPLAHTYETFQPNHPTNPYLEHSMNGTAFYQSTGFQQPVILSITMEVILHC